MSQFHEIVIVGAGFSGIGTAIALKKAGFHDVLLLDDASGPGGFGTGIITLAWRWISRPLVINFRLSKHRIGHVLMLQGVN